MIVMRLFLSFIVFFGFLSPCIGQTVASFDGSWLLTGGWDTSAQAAPRLTLTIGAAGDDLFAEGTYGMRGCGATFTVKGKLAADRTFTLSSRFISITGTFANETPSSWAGSYETSFEGNCTNSSGKFVAKRIEAPRGIYSGVLRTPEGKTITVSVALTAGPFTSQAVPADAKLGETPPGELHFTPITAALNISGLEPTIDGKLTAVGNPSNRVYGDTFNTFFLLKEGYALQLGGTVRNGEATAANVTMTMWDRGKPRISASGMLVRQ